jgi:hypothetical protein
MLLIAAPRYRHQPAFGQPFQFPLHRPGSRADQTDQLVGKETTLRLAKQIAQHPLLGGREEGIRQAGGRSWLRGR